MTGTRFRHRLEICELGKHEVSLTISSPSPEKSGLQILRLKTDLIMFWVILTEIFPGLSLGIVVRRYFMVNLLFLLQRGFLILIKDVLIYLNVIK